MKIGYYIYKNPIPKSETWIRLECEWLESQGHELLFDYVQGDMGDNLKDADFVLIHFAHVALHFTGIYHNVPFAVLPHAWDIWHDDGAVFRELITKPAIQFVGCLSEHHRNKYIEWGCDPEIIVDWVNIVDTETFTRTDNEPMGTKVIAGGRHVAKKGLDIAIKAIPGITIFGDGELTDSLKRTASTQNPNATFVGWLGRKRMRRLMVESNTLIAPSIIVGNGDTEGLSTTIMEALAMGLNVITTVVAGQGGIPGVTYVEPISTKIADKYADILVKGKYKELNTLGSEWVNSTHSPDVVMPKLLGWIDECK